MIEQDNQRLQHRTLRGGLWVPVLCGLLLLGIPARGADIFVNTAPEVAIAAAQAHPGDTLIMRDGVWQDADVLFAAHGSLGSPITLRAQTLGAVHLTGVSRLRISGEFLVVDGLVFTNGFRTSGDVIAFQDATFSVANFSRITNCVIVNYTPPDTSLDTKWVSVYGFSNRVENCFFMGKGNLGTTLIVWVDAAPDRPNYDVIRHNYFGPRPAYTANGAETIRVGTSEVSMNLSRTTVEENFFEQCNGDAEIISSKSCENIYRHNTFVDCEGALSLRHGNRSVVEGNYFFGHSKTLTGGVRITGEDHKVYNNYFVDLAGTSSRAPLAIMQGLVNSPLNGYFQVQRATVAFNTFVNCANPLVVGLVGTLSGSTNITTLPPVDCVIANNLALSSSGKLVDQRITPVNLTWEGNILFGTTLGITNPGGINVVNPQLVLGTDGLWRPGPASPALGAAQGSYPFVTMDMEGQPRPAPGDVGSDQLSTAPTNNPPLRAVDVGPLWMRASGTVLSWSPPADIAYGTALGSAQLNAAANVPGVYAYTPPAGTILNAGNGRILTVTFTPADLVHYSAVTQSVTINILKATPVITWAHPTNINYGTPLGVAQLNASANVPGAFVYTPPAGTVLIVGSNQSLSVTFTPTAVTNYDIAIRSNTITVLQAIPVITWANPAPVPSGTVLGPAQLNATVNVAGTLVYTPPAGTVLSAGSGQPLSVSFIPADAANDAPASRTVTIDVTLGGKFVPMVTWHSPADITYGTPLGAAQLNATANVPGSFAYTPPADSILPIGNGQSLSVTFSPTDTLTYTTATRIVSINVATPVSRAQVRVAYLIPTNRVAQSNGVTILRDTVLTYQEWFRDQMVQNGFAPATFAVETEPDGVTPLIHLVQLPETDSYLRGDIWGGRITNAARAAGLTIGDPGQLWWLIPEVHVQNPDGSISGGFDLASNSGGSGDDPGWAIMGSEGLPFCGTYPVNLTNASGVVTSVVAAPYLTNDDFYDGTIMAGVGSRPMKQGLSFSWFEGGTYSSLGSSALGAGLREIAEGLGLDPDYRNDENFDGNLTGFGFRGLRGVLYPKLYPYNHTRLPYGASLVLSVSRYLNPGRPVTDTTKPAVTFTSPGTVVPVDGLLRISFSASDAGGLHAALLSWEKDEERQLVDEMVLSGTNVSRIFATPYYDVGQTNHYTISVYDLQGNKRSVTASVLPGFTVNRAPQPFLQAHPATVGPGEDIVLDASRTFDPEHSAALLEVEWDFDGDGVFDTEPTTILTVTNHYATLGNRLVRVRVTDAAGDQTVSAPIAVDIVPCAAKLSPSTRTHGYAAGSGGITVTNLGAKCEWTSYTTNDWISITNGGSGVGPGRLTYAVVDNPGDTERVGAIFIGDAVFIVRQSSFACTYSLSPTSRYSGFGVGTGTIKVTTKAGCSWAVVNTNSWVSITSGGSGTGTGTVNYALIKNSTAVPRTGYLLVADQLFLVGQWGTNCTFLVAPLSFANGEGSETGLVTVTSSSACTWNVVNPNSWINITTPLVGAGSGSVGYSLAPNTAAAARIGVINVAGVSVTITQRTCAYTLSPASRIHGTSVEVGTVTVTAGPACTWDVIPSDPWISIIGGASGIGNGAFSYSVSANPGGASRSGLLRVGNQNFTITQFGVGCGYVLSIDGLTAEDIAGEGAELEAFHGDGSEIGAVDVSTTSGCPVTVDNPVPWVHILSGGGSGNTTIIYTVDANPGNPREAFLSIAGQSFQVNQLGGLRGLRAGDMAISSGGTNWMPVVLDSHGTENRFSFSLCFQTNLLSFAGARLGSAVAAGTLTVNSNQASQGSVSVTVALPPGWSISPGNQTVVEIAFRAATVSGKPMTIVSMCDSLSRGVKDVLGQAVPIDYQNALVRIYGDCPLSESLDAPQFVWTTLAGGAWLCQTNFTHDGEDAAASPLLPDSGDSWMETTMIGPGTLSFWWKVSSEPGSDRLRLYMDGNSQLTLSGEVDWQQITFAVPAGSHVMRWRYNKNSSLSAGQDRAWVDDIEFTPTPPVISAQPASKIVDLGSTVTFGVTAAGTPPLTYQWLREGSALADGGRLRGATTPTLTISNAQFSDGAAYSVVISSPVGGITSSNAVLTVTPLITLADAVDAPELAWTTNTTPSWIGQAAVTHDGVDAAQSPGVLDGSSASFFTTVTGPGVLTFWWKVSSESGADYLRLYLNGSKQIEISGEVDWQQLSYTLPSGAQALEWRYKKSSSGSAGQDRGWVDEIRFTGSPAAITTHPAGQAVDSGSTVTFNVTATGSTPLAYRWRSNGVDLADGPGVFGAGTASLVLSNVQPGQPAAYSVRVSNPFGAAVSSNAVLTVGPILPLAEALDATGFNWITTGTPAWVGQSSVTHDGVDAARSGAIPDSGTTTFQTTVTGPGSVSFWWKVSSEGGSADRLRFYLNGSSTDSISGEVDWTFRTFALGTGSQLLEWRYVKNSSLAVGQDRGWVDQIVIVTNGASVAPVIVMQPVSRNIVGGTATSFGALAVGSAAIGYQWQFNGTNLLNGGSVSGATTTNLSLSNVQGAQAGVYTIVASNAAGATMSADALLTVVTAPAITNQPASQNVIVGTTVNLAVGALGMGTLTYQWRLNGTNLANTGNISGATTAALRLTSVLAGQAGVYSVLVTNAAGIALSADALLTVNTTPSLTVQPTNQTVMVGSTATFNVSASGTIPLSYQWRLNGTNLIDNGGVYGSASPTLTLSNVLAAQAGTYSAIVTNLVGSVTTSNALLTVISPPTITIQPIGQTVGQGATVVLSVVATGTAPLGYQWHYNGTNLANGGSASGVTTATLTLANAQPSQSGAYSVIVSNLAGSVMSSDAQTLIRAPLSLAEALDTPSLIWNTSISSPWVAQTNVTHDGYGAARSGTISSNQASWIETTVTGPGVVRFWWKVSSQTNIDLLEFFIGGAQWAYLSGEADWQWRTFAVPPGVQTLRWTYWKDATLNVGQDRAWLDEVEFIPSVGPTVPVLMKQPVGLEVAAGATVTFSAAAEGTPPLSYQWTYNGAELIDSDTVTGSSSPILTVARVTSAREGTYKVMVRNNYSLAVSSNAFLSVLPVIPLSDALDTGTTNMLWITGGYSLWSGQDSVAHDRVDAAQSGPLANNTTNWMETTVAGPLAISFWWKVSSQTNSDRLRFYINGVEQGNISGEQDWRWRTFSVDALSATLRWAYTKDAAGSAGLDRGWIDEITKGPLAPMVTNGPNNVTIVDEGTTIKLRVAASGTPPFGYQWRLNYTNLFESTNFTGAETKGTLIMSNALAWQAGIYSCQVSNEAGVSLSKTGYVFINRGLPLPPALNTPTWTWRTGGDAWWLGDTAVSHDGSQAARNGSLESSSGSTWMETTLVGPGTLTYWWRIQCQTNQDFSRFYINGALQDSITGDRTWKQSMYDLNAGTNIVRWDYTRNGILSNGFNRAFVDEVFFGPIAPIITNQPAPRTVDAGSSVSLSVGVRGTPPLFYRWRLNGTNLNDGGNISGATTATLTLNAIQTAQGGNYSVLVNNSIGQILSTNALVSITPILPLADALDTVGLAWTTSGNGTWVGQPVVQHDGVDAARIAGLTNNESASFQTTVTGPGTITFWWKVSSQASKDFLRFYIGGSELANLSGEIDWQSVSFNIPTGSQVLKWTYAKDGSLSAGQDRAWVDQVVLGATPPAITTQPVSQSVDSGATVNFSVVAGGTPPLTYQWRFNNANLADGANISGSTSAVLRLTGVVPAQMGSYSVVVRNNATSITSSNASLAVATIIPLATALDTTNMVWATNGNPPWVGQNIVSHDGTDAARSGAIADSGTTSFSTSVTGPGTLTFWWKVSSEAGSDRLRFYVNGSSVTEISGEVDWTLYSQSLGSGTQTLEWRYTKNSSTSVGQDRGWVDQIQFGQLAPVIAVQPANQSVEAGATVNFNVSVSGTPPFSYQWRRDGLPLANGTGIAGVTTSNLTLTAVQAAQAGTYSVFVSNVVGNVTSAGASLAITATYTLAEALDNSSLVWTTSGTPPWIGQGAVTHDGTDAARSGATADGTSTSFFTTVNGPGTLTFWWKVSSESGADYLRFYLNGSKQTEISGEVDWQLMSYVLPSGSQALEWRYKKSSSGSAGQDRGWVDQVTFGTPAAQGPVITTQPISQNVNPGSTVTFSVTATGTPPLTYQWRLGGVNIANGPNIAGATSASLTLTNVQPAQNGNYSVVVTSGGISTTSSNASLSVVAAALVSLSDALDATNLVWTTGGSVSSWSGQTTVRHDGADAAQSGPASDSQYSFIKASVTGPGTVSFWWKVSSELSHDFLRFMLNGLDQFTISGEVEWEFRTFAVPTGVQELQWRYSKNSSLAAGLDAAWVDQVLYTPDALPMPLPLPGPLPAPGDPAPTPVLPGSSPAPVVSRIEINGTRAVLTWDASPTRVYQVAYKDDLADAEWTILDGEILIRWKIINDAIVGDSVIASMEDVLAGKTRYYRVIEY